MIATFVFLILYVLIANGGLVFVLQFFRDHRVMAMNYVGKSIPVAGGAYIWFMCLLYAVGIHVLMEWTGYIPFAFPIFLTDYMLGMTVVFVGGFVDDTIGNTHIKGLRGHLRAWHERGEMTTGLLKAGLTALAALWIVVVIDDGVLARTIGWLLLVLVTNVYNLLDVRPGRSLKGGVFVAGMLLVTGAGPQTAFYLFPLLAGMLAYFPYDCKGRAMLGDAGSNLLGFGLGIALLVAYPLWAQALLVLILGAVHVAAERESLSARIERRPMLLWLDRLGRE